MPTEFGWRETVVLQQDSFCIINPLTPELNPSEQACLPEFFPGVLNFIAYS
jgi:hypothetical protein